MRHIRRIDEEDRPRLFEEITRRQYSDLHTYRTGTVVGTRMGATKSKVTRRFDQELVAPEFISPGEAVAAASRLKKTVDETIGRVIGVKLVIDYIDDETLSEHPGWDHFLRMVFNYPEFNSLVRMAVDTGIMSEQNRVVSVYVTFKVEQEGGEMYVSLSVIPKHDFWFLVSADMSFIPPIFRDPAVGHHRDPNSRERPSGIPWGMCFRCDGMTGVLQAAEHSMRRFLEDSYL